MHGGLVSTQWLAEHLYDVDLRIVDATYYLPNEDRDARAEFIAQHIPRACFFDVDACCDASQPYPHMLPDAQIFSRYMTELGITNCDKVIIYDAKGLFSAARLWWMLRLFGHDAARVAVLDGGLPKWVAEERVCASGEECASVVSAPYFADALDVSRVCSANDVLENLKTRTKIVLDARGAARFSGSVAEPRVGVRSGHIPHSINIPYLSVLDEPYSTMKSSVGLCDLFTAAGVTKDSHVITSCGSGVTACVLVLALYQIGMDAVQVYDGAWAQWGTLAHTPVETS